MSHSANLSIANIRLEWIYITLKLYCKSIGAQWLNLFGKMTGRLYCIFSIPKCTKVFIAWYCYENTCPRCAIKEFTWPTCLFENYALKIFTSQLCCIFEMHIIYIYSKHGYESYYCMQLKNTWDIINAILK